EAVPLLGQRAERLGEQAERRRLERELAGAGAERAPGHADHVAQVEQAVDLEALVAQAVTARVDLEPPRPVLHLQEARLAEVAHRHHASRDRQRPRSGQLGLAQGGETRMHLGRRMVRTEVVRVRVDPPLPKRLELFPPDHDLLVVFGHAAEVSETECVYWLPGGGSNMFCEPAPTRGHASSMRPTRRSMRSSSFSTSSVTRHFCIVLAPMII